MSEAENTEEQAEDLELNLSALSPVAGSRRKRKRVGVGEGSGNGKTCGRGQKGAKSRSGYSRMAGFEGGQMPLYRRLPKRGFVSRKKVRGVNVFSLVPLSKIAELGEGEVSLETLKEKGLVRSGERKVKIVSGSPLSSKLVIEAHAVTKSVKVAVENAGGEIKILK